MAPDGVHVVSALHTVGAPKLADLDDGLDEDVPIAGDNKDAKRAVAELIAQIPGLRPIDCGRLEVARLIEGLTPLLISVNGRHKTHAGIRFRDSRAQVVADDQTITGRRSRGARRRVHGAIW